jgi:hypothetical protein
LAAFEARQKAIVYRKSGSTLHRARKTSFNRQQLPRDDINSSLLLCRVLTNAEPGAAGAPPSV